MTQSIALGIPSKPVYNVDVDIKTELIDGKIMKMSPRPSPYHMKKSGVLHTKFNNYFQDKSCEVFYEVGVYLDNKNEFVPDLCIVCDTSLIKSTGIFGAPDLVVEVLSLSTVRYDKGHKKKIYGKYGVKEYWIVDPKSEAVEVYTNVDGILELFDIYTLLSEDELEVLKENDRENYSPKFRSVIFPELEIDLNDIFGWEFKHS